MDDRKKKGEAVNFIDRHFLSRYGSQFLVPIAHFHPSHIAVLEWQTLV